MSKHYGLSDWFTRMAVAPTAQQKELWAKLFVRDWAIASGIKLDREDGAIIWCKWSDRTP